MQQEEAPLTGASLGAPRQYWVPLRTSVQSVNIECFKVRGVIKHQFFDLLLPLYGLEFVHPLTSDS